MKKLLLSAFLLLFLQTFLLSNTMKIEIKNVKIDVPVGWLAQYTNAQQVFFLFSPLEENDNFQENCNLTTEKLTKKYSVKEYIAANVDIIGNYMGDFTLHEAKKNYHIISGTVNNITVKQIQYFYIKKNTAYVLTFTSNPEEFEKYLNTFNTIAKSFKY